MTLSKDERLGSCQNFHIHAGDRRKLDCEKRSRKKTGSTQKFLRSGSSYSSNSRIWHCPTRDRGLLSESELFLLNDFLQDATLQKIIAILPKC